MSRRLTVSAIAAFILMLALAGCSGGGGQPSASSGSGGTPSNASSSGSGSSSGGTSSGASSSGSGSSSGGTSSGASSSGGGSSSGGSSSGTSSSGGGSSSGGSSSGTSSSGGGSSGGDDTGSIPPLGCTPTTGVGTGPGASTEVDFTATDLDGGKRDMRYYIPNPMPSTCMPVVFFLSYLTGGAKQMEALTRADRLASQYGVFVAIAPPANDGRWNDNPVGQPNISRSSDVGFIANQIARIVDSYPVDANRVYLAGYSNSAFMATTVACQRSNLIAGFAEIAGTVKGKIQQTCASMPPMRIVMFNGTSDAVLNYNGVFPGGFLGQGNSFIIAGAQQAEQIWEQHAGCVAPGRKTTTLPNKVDDGTSIVLTENTDCSGDAAVALFTINGGGHTWPGNQVSGLAGTKDNLTLGKTTQNIDATIALWKFLAGDTAEP